MEREVPPVGLGIRLATKQHEWYLGLKNGHKQKCAEPGENPR